jgi:hypothetical protein
MSSPRDRPDATVRRGHATAVVSGDRALQLIDLAGVVREPTFSGWVVPLVDLPRLRAVALSPGWHLVTHWPHPIPVSGALMGSRRTDGADRAPVAPRHRPGSQNRSRRPRCPD